MGRSISQRQIQLLHLSSVSKCQGFNPKSKGSSKGPGDHGVAPRSRFAVSFLQRPLKPPRHGCHAPFAAPMLCPPSCRRCADRGPRLIFLLGDQAGCYGLIFKY